MEMTQINDIRATVDSDRAHVWHHLFQHAALDQKDPRIFVEGRGMKLWDQNGREFLDSVSGGLWTVNVGYGRESMANAIRDQVLKMNFFGGNMGTVPAAQFAEQITSKTPGLDRVFFLNSGSEANEKAFKMVRQIAHQHHGGKKWKILYRDRDYHGSTFGAMAATGQGQRKAHFGPFPDGFVAVPHCLEYRAQWDVENYGVRAADAVEEVILREGPDTIGAICLEPMTAGGGVITPPAGYWERLQEICTKYDILIHMDEVVCGMGRTGEWFGYQNYGIKPDIITTAKGVASGYAAISCLITTEDVFQKFRTNPADPMSMFRDISTFGGCTAGPAAAMENMRIIEDENLLDNSKKMGAYLMDKLFEIKDRHAIVGDVRGQGLFCGLELVADRETREPLAEALVDKVVAGCDAESVLIGKTARAIEGFNNTLCLAPSLIVGESEINQITETLDRALSAIPTCA
ncbi:MULTISPECIES: aminotransferase family protein [Pacificibacter]|uniref:aminotransferase family protein n=1 Tax=Pacificibacter TaxID=1042323 RepID=UPI001C08E725|nr:MULTISPECIES: aminotransferase class III-fold pyridoxal phosphate-dependent enzyme [Pacificibacter]MBU2936777.1 aminotransferase class III-fold pyridoxal phosphate-dependent enzyme [Pacificibacter marinus]MDO6614769.1 aminotransferase class III-fold pyridoxal phosphate-dependent enzyme [Pacificibacter sp. 1_MG-2023]